MTMAVAVDTATTLGECVRWCERTGRVLWTDIGNATLWTHIPATGAAQLAAAPACALFAQAAGVRGVPEARFVSTAHTNLDIDNA